MMKCLKTLSSLDDVDYAKNYDFIVVEDSYNEAFLLDSIVSRMDPMPVCGWINDARLAVEMVKKELFPKTKLILLDVKMPLMTGLECLEQVKGTYNYSRSPIVMLSSSDHISDVKNAYENHCNGYLVKSDNMAEFKKKITATIIYWTTINTIN